VITQDRTISFTADSKSPARGAIAPRSPSIPARQFSGSSQGAKSWWCRAALPKSHRMGSWSRVKRQYRVILSPRAPPIQCPIRSECCRSRRQERAELTGSSALRAPLYPIIPESVEIDSRLEVHAYMTGRDYRRAESLSHALPPLNPSSTLMFSASMTRPALRPARAVARRSRRQHARADGTDNHLRAQSRHWHRHTQLLGRAIPRSKSFRNNTGVKVGVKSRFTKAASCSGEC